MVSSNTGDVWVQAASGGLCYAMGDSTLGRFLAATDEAGLCAVLFGEEDIELVTKLRAAFPNRPNVSLCKSDALADTVAKIIERPRMAPGLPISGHKGDFDQMVSTALRGTQPGTTITPGRLALQIGAAVESAPYVRARARSDIFAVVVPFHRLQESDGTSPSYRWGEERRKKLLAREAASRGV